MSLIGMDPLAPLTTARAAYKATYTSEPAWLVLSSSLQGVQAPAFLVSLCLSFFFFSFFPPTLKAPIVSFLSPASYLHLRDPEDQLSLA